MVALNIHMVRQARGSNVVAPFGRSDIVVARSPRGQGLFLVISINLHCDL